MEQENKMELKFISLSQNESFARVCAAAFAAQLDPTLEEIDDIKTAISEAVTNAVVHAYPESPGEIILRGNLKPDAVVYEIIDFGKGISDLPQALEPLYTTCPGEERSGMGFTVMQTFMDEMQVHSAPGKGTTVLLQKRISGGKA